MASFKKFLAGTLVTAAAAVCGIAVYKKLQANNANDNDDFDDFEDDDFDDDFEDLDIENRNYTSISSEASATTEEDTVETSSEKETTATSESTDTYAKSNYSMDNSFYSRSSY